ncbi:hypothetical protein CANARDRAFT_29512 [[Candida] arabinofermentans NRRL YB-2248]|uniref:Uncharacterized protein n=1 Tax=[Candida] arabinofermentans NRRL YB-2248 TaxID=983967 RepID=A0A1E4SX59_9ASCO|nr:hypothetical protein CANARDRAFT_29512 [[Candida] arabinofermentans NRRL YB-2248]
MYSRVLFANLAKEKVLVHIESDDGFKYEHDDRDYVLEYLEKGTNDQQLDKVAGLQVFLNVTIGRDSYKGEYNTNTGSSSGFVKDMYPSNWTYWSSVLLLTGKLDSNYTFSIVTNRENKNEFVVSRKIKGISRRLISIELKLARSEEGQGERDSNLVKELAILYEKNLRDQETIKSLTNKVEILENDLKSSLDGFDLCKKSLKRQRMMIDKIVIPMINEKKKIINKLLKEKAETPFLYSSVTKDDGVLINYQKPHETIEFQFDKEKEDEYLKEIMDVSPRKKKRKVREKEVKSPSDKTVENDVTDEYMTDDDLELKQESLVFNPSRKLKFVKVQFNKNDDSTEDENETEHFSEKKSTTVQETLNTNDGLDGNDDDVTQSGSDTELDE